MHFVIAALFVFFAAVHGGYEKTPYQAGTPSFWNGAIGHSWLLNGLGLPAEAVKSIGQLMWVIPMAGFILTGAALVGWFVPFAWWRPLAIGSATGSLLLWLLFFHPMQWASALLNVAFLAVLLGTDWASRLSPR